MANRNIILIAGKSTTGKSTSLMNLKNPEGVMYLNCEANKELPFPHKFQAYTITDPLQVFEAFDHAENDPSIHTIALDSLTFLMDMYESLYIHTASDTRAAWGEYANFYNMLTQQKMAESTKRIAVIAHTADVLNETENVREVRVKVKGSIMNKGVEAAFTNVLATKRMPLEKLEDYKNDLLLPEGEGYTDDYGYRHVFQTNPTKDTTAEHIRTPLRMFNKKETFIDNDLEAVFNRIEEYYNQ